MATKLFEAIFNGSAGSVTDQGLEKHGGFTGADLVRTGSGTAYPTTGSNTILLPTVVGDIGTAYVESGLTVKTTPGPTGGYAGLMVRGSNSVGQWHLQGMNYDSSYAYFGYDTAFNDYAEQVGPTSYIPNHRL